MFPSDIAAGKFSAGYNCAQSVLQAFSEEQGLDATSAIRIAASFGGGVGRSGSLCGAMTGALMALSLATATLDPMDKEAKERNYTLTRRFVETFEARFGSTTCPGLLGYHIGIPEEAQAAREQGVFKTHCPQYVRGAAEILAEMLEKNQG